MKALFYVFAFLLPAAVLAATPVGWRNLDDAHHLGGRRMSEGYLRGKIVVVDRWGVRCPPCRALLPRLEILWQTFNEKPFVLIGGHCDGWGTAESVKKVIAKNHLTYPVYQEAAIQRGEPRFTAIPFLYVVDSAGNIIYQGSDEREATDTVVSAIVDLEDPSTVERWRFHIDNEIAILPGRAFRRLREFRKKFPEEAKAYDAEYAKLAAIPEIDRLVRLVDIARKVREYRVRDAAENRKMSKRIDETVSRYATLKDHPDPRVAQEAKNAIADLIWVKDEL